MPCNFRIYKISQDFARADSQCFKCGHLDNSYAYKHLNCNGLQMQHMIQTVKAALANPVESLGSE